MLLKLSYELLVLNIVFKVNIVQLATSISLCFVYYASFESLTNMLLNPVLSGN